MRKNPRLFRLSATVAMAALFSNAILPLVATAQPAPPPGAAQPGQYQGDPPARVGRVANLSGAVSFRTTADSQWSTASANFPVSSGNSFWTDNGAQAGLEISDSRIVLAPQTELDVTTLDPSGLQAVLAQGEAYLRLDNLAPNETWTLQTPRGSVKITAAGRYGIVIGSTEAPTQVTVLEGAAEIDGPGVALHLNPNETATITGTDPFQGSVGPAVHDAFLGAQLNAERPPPRAVASLPAEVAEQVAAMPGGSDLYASGQWSQAPDYGQVWYPPVQAGWAPYRHGHWAFVAPWGWTWVDDAPWGFAPFHYGRWVQIGNRWAWTPGVVAVSGPAVYSPVYAPALVAFVGFGVGVAVGAALASGSIGWIPLGPREVYHPWYHASDNYFRQVNVAHVSNISSITNVSNVSNVRNTNVRNTTVNNVTVNNYINRGAATVVPASVMTGSRPVQAAARAVTPQQLATARPVLGEQPIRPAASTAGVTPAVARQFSLPPAVPGSVRTAPGPAVGRTQAVTPGTLAARPALPQTRGGQPVATPAAVAVPHPPGAPSSLVRPSVEATQPNLAPASRPASMPGATEHLNATPATEGAIHQPNAVPAAMPRAAQAPAAASHPVATEPRPQVVQPAPPVRNLPQAPPVHNPPPAAPVRSLPQAAPVHNPPPAAPVRNLPQAAPVHAPPQAAPVRNLPQAAPVYNPPPAAPVRNVPQAPPVYHPTAEAAPRPAPQAYHPPAPREAPQQAARPAPQQPPAPQRQDKRPGER